MREFTLIFYILFMMHTSFASSQKRTDSKINLIENNLTLVEIFNHITNSTSYNFTYGSYIKDKTQRFDINYENQTLESILIDLGELANFSFKVDENEIMISKKNEKVGFSNTTYQNFEITGIVKDNLGIPIPDVNVSIKGSKKGTVTDFDGKFSLVLPDGFAILEISYIGFKTVEIEVGNKTYFEITLQENDDQLDEVVLIGYGQVDRSNVVTSISSISSKDIKDLPVTSIDQALIGQVAGVNVVQESGVPGSNLSFRIRGLTAISTSAEPLIVLDGIPLDRGARLAAIDPNTVESIDVLKDAAAAAIYGSRGSNGVVLIKTKRGKAGVTSYSFNSFTGVQDAINVIDIQDAYGQARYINEALRNDYLFNNPTQPFPNDPTIYGFPEMLIPYLNNEPGLTNTNWQEEVLQNGIIQSYELSARGGNDKMRYFISGNYFDQEGIVISTDFERIALRSNIDVNLSDKLQLSLDLAPSYSQSNRVHDGISNINNFRAPVVSTAQYVSPFFEPYLPNGDIASDSVIEGSFAIRDASNNFINLAPYVNPIALAELNTLERREFRFLGSIALEYELIKDLKFRSQASIDFARQEDNFFKPSTLGRRGVPSYSEENEIFGEFDGLTGVNWVVENTMTYHKKFNHHNFNFLGGYTAQKFKNKTESITSNNFPNDQVQTLNAGVVVNASTFISEFSLMSLLSRVTYDFKNTYYISASIRRDGSSRFGKNNRFGTFPAVGVAYRISNESFFPKNIFLSDAKMRASWGETGNFNIPNFGALARLGNTNYPFGNTVQPGLAITTSPNADLAWESTKTYDVGLDLGFLNNQINLTLDYYQTKTDDLLFNLPVPSQSGFERTLQNVGSLKSYGFEATLSANLRFGELIWQPNINFSRDRHEVVSLNIEDTGITDWYWRTEEGGIVGAFWGYNSLGLITSQEQIDNNPTIENAQVGNSYLWEDANGDGIINTDDKTIIGNPYPEYYLNFGSSFVFKNIDFSFMVQSVQNFDVFWNAGRDRFLDQTLWTPKTVFYAQNTYQSPENPGIYPRPYRTNQPDGDFYRDSNINLFDGSFVRIRNITLGYTFSNKLTEQIGVNNARVYFSTNNPFTFTNYPGYDPEASNHSSASDSRPNGITPRPGRDLDTYPTAKNFTLGINLTF